MKMNSACMLQAAMILGSCFLSHESASQTERFLYRGKGVYLAPPKITQSIPAVNAGFTNAQVKILSDNMNSFMELVHQKTKCINPPAGYEVGVYAGICGDGSCSEGKVLAGAAGLIIREYTTTKTNPLPERAVEGPSINFFFNDIRSMLKSGFSKDGYSERLQVRTIAGCPVLEGGYVVITKIKKPLIRYISNERYWKGMIKNEEESIQRAKTEFAKGSAYQQWLRDKESTLKAIKEGLDIVAKTNPADAKAKWEKTRSDFDKMEQELKKQEAGQLEANKQFIIPFEKRLEEYKNKLASLSAEERKAPATGTNGKKLVEPNPDFFDPSRKPTDLQLVIIDLYRYDLEEGWFAHQLIRIIREQMDIAALAASIK